MKLFHGGVSGQKPGDILIPYPPHKVCGCPICEARSEGRVCRIWEYREWLAGFGDRGESILKMLEGANPMDPIDPPSEKSAVYVTSSVMYARWYAARSKGDLYEVEPIGDVERSDEDGFASWTCQSARIVRVIERKVKLTRKDRREILKKWKKVDANAKFAGRRTMAEV